MSVLVALPSDEQLKSNLKIFIPSKIPYLFAYPQFLNNLNFINMDAIRINLSKQFFATAASVQERLIFEKYIFALIFAAINQERLLIESDHYWSGYGISSDSVAQ